MVDSTPTSFLQVFFREQPVLARLRNIPQLHARLCEGDRRLLVYSELNGTAYEFRTTRLAPCLDSLLSSEPTRAPLDDFDYFSPVAPFPARFVALLALRVATAFIN